MPPPPSSVLSCCPFHSFFLAVLLALLLPDDCQQCGLAVRLSYVQLVSSPKFAVARSFCCVSKEQLKHLLQAQLKLLQMKQL